ncbi:MAG: glycosyltransferase family 4 protein [Candidatus Nanohalobium sp.]
MESKKVAVLASRFYRYGGIPRVVTRLLDNLEEIEGLEFDVITSRTDFYWAERVDADIKQISTYPHPVLSFFNPLTIRKMEEYDLVWIHNTYLNRLSTILDTPTIATFHPPHRRYSSIFDFERGVQATLESFLQERGLRYLQFTDRVVGISDEVRERLTEHYKANAVRIYHGADLPASEKSATSEEFIFAFAVDATVESVAEDYPVKALTSTGQIEEIEDKTDSGLISAIKRSKFVVSGSFQEGFGLEPVEAAFCGKPAVVRAVGGHEETINHGETGYLANNSKEFKKFVEKLWGDEALREKMGGKAFERAKDKFTWRRASLKYLEEFNDLMGTSFQLN